MYREEHLYKVIGARIREIRVSREMSQADLSKRLAISQPQLSGVERGRGDLGLHLLERLCTTLQVAPEALIANNYLSREQTRIANLEEKIKVLLERNELLEKIIQKQIESKK